MKVLWKDHRELFIVFFGLASLVSGMTVELATEETVLPYAHDIGYTIWMFCYCYWLFAITKKTRARHLHSDERALDDHALYRSMRDIDMEYFVVDESNHTTINWMRKLRGKLTVRLFKGQMLGGGITAVSNTSYVVTKKQLFEMRLKGFTNRASEDVVKAALQNEWLQQFRAWVK